MALFDDLMQPQAPAPAPRAPAKGGGLFDDLVQSPAPAAGPSDFDPHISAASKKYGLPEPLLRSQIQAESSFNPNARSPAGAQGLMQLMPGTAKEMGVTNPYDPAQNIDGGAKYMRWLLDQFGGDTDKALAAYNFGIGRVKAGQPLPQETRDYIARVQQGAGIRSTGQPDRGGPAFLQHAQGTLQQQTQLPPDRRNFGTDVGVAISQGLMDVPQAALGLYDIVSQGGGQRALRDQGIDLQQARAQQERNFTPEMLLQQRNVEQADGFLPMAEQMLTNPRAAAGMIARSAPPMIAGGMVGGAIAPVVGPTAGAAVGEGLMSAGSTARNIQDQTGQPLTGRQALLSAGAGAATGLLGAAGASIGRKLGIADIDVQLAGGNGANVAISLVNRVLRSAGLESVEEMGQSSQEQVLTNLASGKDPLQGVGASAAQGGILGGAMGGAAGVRAPNVQQGADPLQAASGPLPAPAPTPPAPMGTPSPAPVQAPLQAPPASPVQPATLGRVPFASLRGGAAPSDNRLTPFAGSQDVSQLYRAMNIPEAHRDRALQLLAPDEPNIEAARRGTMSWEETGNLAALAGTTIDDLRNRRKGQAYNAEEYVAATRQLKEITGRTLDLSSRIKTGLATDLDKANLLQQLDDLRVAQSAVMGGRAEIGRALNVMKADVVSMKEANRLLDSVGGAQGVDAIANALQTALEKGGIEAMNKQASKNANSDAFWTFYKSMLLSSPDTHAVNVTSNLATAVLQIPERMAAGLIGTGKRVLSRGRYGEVRLGEPFYQAAGLLEGMTAGMRAAAESWKTGADPFGINKAEQITTQAPGQKVWGAPLRLLQSEDAFFQMVNEGTERYAQAYRQASKEGGSVQQITQRARELINNPTTEIKEASESAALVNTFNSRAGHIVQTINRVRLTVPGGQLIIPFLRTPANVINYALKRTPLAPLYSEVREDIKAGGAKQELAIARVATGSLIQSAAVMAYLAGNLTGGGPEDKEDRKAWLSAGNQPYSIKINGRWVDYSRLDPFASLVGIAADVAAQHQDADAGTATLIKAIGRNFMSKTWLQGLSGAMQAMTDPDRYGETWVNRTAATLMQPATLLSHVGRWQDPYKRAPEGFLESLQYRLPAIPGTGFQGREGLPVQLDAFGEPIREAERQFGRAGPFQVSTPTDDPVRQEAAQIGWQPPVPAANFKLRGKTVEFTPEEHDKLKRVAGQAAKRIAGNVMRHPNYRGLDPDQKKTVLDREVSRVVDEIRTAAKTDHQLKTRRLDALARQLGIPTENP